MARVDAEYRCAKDPACLGLHWLNNKGGDGRTASTGWYQACSGNVPGATNNDWDIIVKPTNNCAGDFWFH